MCNSISASRRCIYSEVYNGSLDRIRAPKSRSAQAGFHAETSSLVSASRHCPAPGGGGGEEEERKTNIRVGGRKTLEEEVTSVLCTSTI